MKVVAVGSKEMCDGFRLAGVKELHYRESVKDIDGLVERLMAREDVGLIIMDDGAYSSLGRQLKKRIETVAKPSVVTLPNYGSRTVESESLEALVKRALGFELR